MPRKLLQNRPRDLELFLYRLIGIGRRPNCNIFSSFHPAQFLTQKFSRLLLGINLLLELKAVAHLHKLVGVARVTIFAGKLAPAVRIDRPCERHARAGAAVEQRPHRKRKVLDFMPLAHTFAMRRQPGNAAQPRTGIGKQGEGGHRIRLLFAIIARSSLAAHSSLFRRKDTEKRSSSFLRGSLSPWVK